MQLTETDLVYAVMHLHAAVVTVLALALDLVRLFSIHLGEDDDDDDVGIAGGKCVGGGRDTDCDSAGARFLMGLSQFQIRILFVLRHKTVDLLLLQGK